MFWHRPSTTLLHFCSGPCGRHSANWVRQAETRGRWSGGQHLETWEEHKSLAKYRLDTSEVLQSVRFIKNGNKERLCTISRFKTDKSWQGKCIFLFLNIWMRLLILQMSRSHIYYHSGGKKHKQKISPHHPEWCGTEVLSLLKDGLHSRECTWLTPLPQNLLLKAITLSKTMQQAYKFAFLNITVCVSDSSCHTETVCNSYSS